MIDSSSIGVFAALGSAVSWAVGAVLFKQLGKSISSFAMTLMQSAMSVLLLGLITFSTNSFSNISNSAYIYLTISGVLGISLSGTLFFRALKELSAQAITMLFMLGQVCTILFSVFFLEESLSLPGWIGIFLVISGIAVGIFPGNFQERHSTKRGIAFGLMSVFLMSIATILTKKGLVGDVSTIYATFIRMLAGTFGMLLVGIPTGRIINWIAPFSDVRLVCKFVISVCIIAFGGFWLSIVAFKYTSVAVASSLISTESIFVIPVAALFLDKKITLKSITGASIATVGVVVLCMG